MMWLVLALLASEPSGLDGLAVAYNVLDDPATQDYEIYVVDTNGTNARNVSNSKGVDWVYFAHGDKLYFVSDRGRQARDFRLYEMDADGENVRQVTPFAVADSWLSRRADGLLAITSNKDGAQELYLIDAQGKERRRLTENDFYENDPLFSPDGSQLVFRAKPQGHIAELWVMDLESGERRQLTRFPADDPAAKEANTYHAGAPRWAPKRNWVTFTSHRGGNMSIHAVKPDGSGLKRLTQGDGHEVWHDWSPDGAWLVHDESSSGYAFGLVLLHVDRGERRVLIDTDKIEQAPTFVRVR